MTGHYDTNGYERWRDSRTGVDGDSLMEGPEAWRETTYLDDTTPAPWQVALYVGAVTFAVALGAARILAAIWASHQ